MDTERLDEALNRLTDIRLDEFIKFLAALHYSSTPERLDDALAQARIMPVQDLARVIRQVEYTGNLEHLPALVRQHNSLQLLVQLANRVLPPADVLQFIREMNKSGQLKPKPRSCYRDDDEDDPLPEYDPTADYYTRESGEA